MCPRDAKRRDEGKQRRKKEQVISWNYSPLLKFQEVDPAFNRETMLNTSHKNQVIQMIAHELSMTIQDFQVINLAT